MNDMSDEEYDSWVSKQRDRVNAYLESQGIPSPDVQWPAFDVPPHFAIWAVESKKAPGKVGWWAFSGDCPTDYVSEDGNCHPRSALKTLLDRWTRHASDWGAGRQAEGVRIGSGSNSQADGELLARRVAVLRGWHEDDKLWEDL
jgi:hypothetical protein